ncbi:MAG: heavy metal-responsive transcriptional regulator [Actinomycetota bacterium]|nr:heavy metal-responsive transcriptional regulator [Actinomycetota bacterium]
MGGRMTIGELGARVGVNPKTIRFYEDRGLLPAPARRPSGYRDYGEEDVTRLSFIRTAQRLGFNLSEVAEILAFKERGERPCDYVLQVLDAQVADVDRRLGELVALRAELVALKAKADRLPADDECYCRIVEHADPALSHARRSMGASSRELGSRRDLTVAGFAHGDPPEATG